LTGFTAKEAVISTFAVLGGASLAELPAALGQIFSPLAAFSFLVFTLLYTPCVAAVTAVRREMNSTASALGVVCYQTGVAWVAAFVVYQLGSLLIR
ncbi:MAG: ferrous iron transport protein B, partial [Hydrogeniiclostridium mannosilyticum]